MFITALSYIGSSKRSVLQEGAIIDKGIVESSLGAVPTVYQDSQSSYLQGIHATKSERRISEVVTDVNAQNFPVKKTDVNSSIGGRRGVYAKAHSNYLQQIYGNEASE